DLFNCGPHDARRGQSGGKGIPDLATKVGPELALGEIKPCGPECVQKGLAQVKNYFQKATADTEDPQDEEAKKWRGRHGIDKDNVRYMTPEDYQPGRIIAKTNQLLNVRWAPGAPGVMIYEVSPKDTPTPGDYEPFGFTYRGASYTVNLIKTNVATELLVQFSPEVETFQRANHIILTEAVKKPKQNRIELQGDLFTLGEGGKFSLRPAGKEKKKPD